MLPGAKPLSKAYGPTGPGFGRPANALLFTFTRIFGSWSGHTSWFSRDASIWRDTGNMFDVDALIADCRDAAAESESRRAVREVLLRTVDEADAVAAALKPTEGGLNILYRSPDLTVLDVVWAPGMRLYPHDHRMWAAIGIYAGQEDNTFYRRSGARNHQLTESGGKELRTGDVLLLGDDAIHAVANPLGRLTAAIHVYGGDFVDQPRSQWGPGSLEERPYDMQEVQRQFAEANRVWRVTTSPAGQPAQNPGGSE
jgi:predicted metal-dependent enzyme (double-stranded beta helix superfamily)